MRLAEAVTVCCDEYGGRCHLLYCCLLFTDILSAVHSIVCVDFEDSLNVTPRQPYNPSLRPDRAILKPSPDIAPLEAPKMAKRKSFRTRPQAADFF